MTIKLYRNYGCLSAEKRQIYTYGNPQPTAPIFEEIEVEIPSDWSVAHNKANELLLVSPWGQAYLPNEVLAGDEYPLIEVIDNHGNRYKRALLEIE